ncbi:hypothetical protein ASF72_00145 [Arthrobacter sp. Leaf141]|uniref:hypothetical protein n=1 Tax=Arthrobacter sp. Leaf141 TaxID=1736273 RepID=UPI0006F936BA|nr:hypothetical protein [Arthrobacter sp. Leaf141]KQR04858.1 hypothetical protein ASF72_00145 [Arthrobacter sp. Leaf141]
MTDGDNPAASEPRYEPIGDGSPGVGDADDVSGGPPSPAAPHIWFLLRRGFAAGLKGTRSRWFWGWSAAVLAVCCCAGALLVSAAVAIGGLPPDSHGWTYILTAAALVVACCVLAIRWGAVPVLPGPPDGRADGPWRGWAQATVKGTVFAAAAGLLLTVFAALTDSGPAVAAVSFGLMVVEAVVFAGIGAGAACWFEDWRGRALAWGMAGLLLVGNVGAVVALLPTVRAEELVLVTINIQRDELGRVTSYSCSSEVSGTSVVDHTERIMWLATSHPVVLLALLAGETDPRVDAINWVPGELQAAAEGTQVPCVAGNDGEEAGSGVPLAPVGFGTQLAAAGVVLAAGQRAAGRSRKLPV